ncbi:RNA 3'-terminal phosphate cyclase/enolpyruvate transferase, alpha/beta [Actinidia rufa]|uniref:RNA 3'-terminal phosphate cyclase/enolpyruvate transferase, alpha/beta n=1 Tax=Actinidia rufa TaxID=165716 RepID=A0A7J0F6G5_9ERIC|nr:RNA 3'-terminal phosphate cyclase/enolpyruvate transferase, alpha/beta [Actinidia rufa]
MASVSQFSGRIQGVRNSALVPDHNQRPLLGSVQFGSKLKGSDIRWCLSHGRGTVRASLRVLASVATAEKPPEKVLQPIKEISGTVKLPGSKSLSNRILLLAALSEGITVVDNLLNSDDVHYMLGALRTLGLHVEEDSAIKRAIVEGCGGLFPVGKESRDKIQLFLGNAGTAMRPLTAAVTAAGGNSRSGQVVLYDEVILATETPVMLKGIIWRSLPDSFYLFFILFTSILLLDFI